jgi:hypothetical protein
LGEGLGSYKPGSEEGWAGRPQQAFLPTDGLAYPTVSCPTILLESSESLQLANVIIINQSAANKRTQIWFGEDSKVVTRLQCGCTQTQGIIDKLIYLDLTVREQRTARVSRFVSKGRITHPQTLESRRQGKNIKKIRCPMILSRCDVVGVAVEQDRQSCRQPTDHD